ncbi:MAG: adenylyl-sulfate kinase [Candidatus Rokubacteria bacterium]|nr:adenylyl-sulfate kinase [Candidatus Rokubacteria bacterium]
MSWAIWITGLPGSGKTALARAVAAALRARGRAVRVLELDAVRKVLTPEPTYTGDEREIVYRALVYMAKLLVEAGVPVVIDATGHRRAWRELARALIPLFAEVELRCPLPLCIERERKRHGGLAPAGIYERAGEPGSTVPGVDVPYEESRGAELVLDSNSMDLWAQAQEVLYLARRLCRQAARKEHCRPIRSREAYRLYFQQWEEDEDASS